ncbi:heterokaryon incompatibility protein-domain-containing protein [Hypoxylon rubiginosum]|uniref:Heterokaryon incompatibility protein-domain-containing protein n=1 Tax=Hypoxylon rubiginosum TaxID=110542 RepID=A0ACB9Z6I1_9PEZI|nr:heterokaryon incompatibility protein-domain-containing protein [Hypoxylon rubiginosum]
MLVNDMATMSSHEAPSIYTPLRYNIPEIRVLILLPSCDFQSDIECGLKRVPLRDPAIGRTESETYEAVSYVWGAPEKVRRITINGQLVSITRNVEAMLRYFRHSQSKRNLWIDLLCINQDDVGERSQQVQLMKNIYTYSSNCLAWLPEYKDRFSGATTNSKVVNDPSRVPKSEEEWDKVVHQEIDAICKGMQVWEKLQAHYLRYLSQTAPDILEVWQEYLVERSVHYCPTTLEIEPLGPLEDSLLLQTSGEAISKSTPPDESITERLWLINDQFETYNSICHISLDQEDHLQKVFDKPSIWKRIWTMQELVCAPSVVLVSGHKSILFPEIAALFLDDFVEKTFSSNWHSGGSLTQHIKYTIYGGFNRVYAQRQSRWSVDPLSPPDRRPSTLHAVKSRLWNIFAQFRNSLATDPRDYIYGLLGLVTEECDIVVDYKKAPGEVFTEAAIAVINSTKNLDIVCQMGYLSCEHGFKGGDLGIDLPSWVPDFSRRPYHGRGPGVLFAGDPGERLYDAWNCPLSTPVEVLDGGLLQTKVVKLGTFKADYHREPLYRDYKRAIVRLGEWLAEHENGFNILDDDAAVLYQHTGEPAFQAYWRTILMDCADEPLERDPLERLNEDDIEEGDSPFWAILRHLRKEFEMYHGFDVEDLQLDNHWEEMPYRLVCRFDDTYKDWRFAVTNNKLYTMVCDVQQGDIVVVAEGAKVPLVIRPKSVHEGEGKWRGMEVYSLVGTAYVHGFMDGRAVQEANRGDRKVETVLFR